MGAKFTKPDAYITPQSNEKAEKIINYIMKNGKKAVARRLYDDTLKEIKANGHVNPLTVVYAAIENASPEIMVKSKRIGGAVYQVPIEVRADKKVFYACQWLLKAARSKKGAGFSKNFAEELLAAYSNQGNAVKKKEEVHKMAEANKAFAYMAKYVK